MIKKLLISLVVIWCIVFGGYFISSRYYISVVNNPLKSTSEDIQFEVKSGDTLYNVISRLSKEGKLKNEFIVRYYIKANKINLKLKPGIGVLKKSMSIDQFLTSLEAVKPEVDPNAIKLTIPEGYTVEDIADLLEEKGVIKRDIFLKAVKEYPLPSYVKVNKEKRYSLEGYLFPDTYIFKKDEDPIEIVKVFIDSFEKNLNSIKQATGKDIKDEEIENIIIKAAMIEKEAKIDDDRPKIASVISNRLQKNMKLQIDATVLYALGQHKEAISSNDLKVVSPFSTYNVSGLPVGPIANPGRKSIEAAINPAQTDYLYYVMTKDNKTHYFTKDYEDFLKKKKEYKN